MLIFIELTVAILVASFLIKLVWYFVRQPPASSHKITIGSKLPQDLLHLSVQDCMPPLPQWEEWIENLFDKAFTGINGSKNYYYFAAAMLERLCYPLGYVDKPKKTSSRFSQESAKEKRLSFEDVQKEHNLPKLRPIDGKQVYII